MRGREGWGGGEGCGRWRGSKGGGTEGKRHQEMQHGKAYRKEREDRTEAYTRAHITSLLLTHGSSIEQLVQVDHVPLYGDDRSNGFCF